MFLFLGVNNRVKFLTRSTNTPFVRHAGSPRRCKKAVPQLGVRAAAAGVPETKSDGAMIMHLKSVALPARVVYACSLSLSLFLSLSLSPPLSLLRPVLRPLSLSLSPPPCSPGLSSAVVRRRMRRRPISITPCTPPSYCPTSATPHRSLLSPTQLLPLLLLLPTLLGVIVVVKVVSDRRCRWLRPPAVSPLPAAPPLRCCRWGGGVSCTACSPVKSPERAVAARGKGPCTCPSTPGTPQTLLPAAASTRRRRRRRRR